MCTGHVTRATLRLSQLVQKSSDGAHITWEGSWLRKEGVEGCVAAERACVCQPDTQAEDQSQQVHGTLRRHHGCHGVDQTLVEAAAIAMSLERRTAWYCTHPLQDVTEVQSSMISWTRLPMPLEKPWT